MKKHLLLLVLLLSSCGGNSSSSDSSMMSNTTSPTTGSNVVDVTSSIVDSTSDIEVIKSFSLNPNLVPGNVDGSYPIDGDFSCGEVSFYFSNVMKNEGKYSSNTIQMKKAIGYFYNINPIDGELTISLMKNSYKDYANDVYVNTHTAPKVYASNSSTFSEYVLTYEVLEENDTEITYKYNNLDSFKYFKIANESGYAQYLTKVEWKN